MYFFFLVQFGFFLFGLSNTVWFSFLYPFCNILPVYNNNILFSFSFLSCFFYVILCSHRYWVFLFWFLCSPLFNQGLHILFHLFSLFRRIGAYLVMVSELFLWRALLRALSSSFSSSLYLFSTYVPFLFFFQQNRLQWNLLQTTTFIFILVKTLRLHWFHRFLTRRIIILGVGLS